MLSIVVFDVKNVARFVCVRHLALMQTTPLFPTLHTAITTVTTIVSIYQNNTKKYLIHNVDRLVTLYSCFAEQDQINFANSAKHKLNSAKCLFHYSNYYLINSKKITPMSLLEAQIVL